MILVGRLQAVAGKPGIFGGRPQWRTRMISDLPGDAGHRELVAFGRRLGISPGWVRRVRSDEEHFDLALEETMRALDCGATVVSQAALVWAMVAKRWALMHGELPAVGKEKDSDLVS